MSASTARATRHVRVGECLQPGVAVAAGLAARDELGCDYRGRTEGNEVEIVAGDLADIDSCDAVLAAFTSPDEGTAMEAWYARSCGKPIVAYTGGAPPHPWGPFTWPTWCAPTSSRRCECYQPG